MRITAYGTKSKLKQLLAKKRTDYIKLYVPINKSLDNHEEEN